MVTPEGEGLEVQSIKCVKPVFPGTEVALKTSIPVALLVLTGVILNRAVISLMFNLQLHRVPLLLEGLKGSVSGRREVREVSRWSESCGSSW